MEDKQSFARFLKQNAVVLPLIVFCGYIVAESYQIDYRAFYVAGKSVLLGLDPYLNHVGQRPELYAALNAEAQPYSAFRYPPIAALAFAPLALLPYEISRIVFALATFFMALAVGWWSFGGEQSNDKHHLALALALVCLPLQSIFQRGQVDLALVLLSLFAFSTWNRKPSSNNGPALLAAAAVLKVFPGILVIFFALKRQWSFVAKFAAWTTGLFLLPLPLFGLETYRNFARRSLPEIFGQIQARLPINLAGQKTVFFGSANYVDAIEGRGMVASRDYVGGGMNPLLFDHSILAVLAGLAGVIAITYALRKQSGTYQFLAILNVVNLANPLSWLMGIAWYTPFFLRYFPKASTSERLILLAPLFLPPAICLNAYAAIAIPLLPKIRALSALQTGKVVNAR